MINKKKLHHGSCKNNLTPVMASDYFWFSHSDCKNDDVLIQSIMEVEAIKQCPNGRILLQLKCSHCGHRDTLKPVLTEKTVSIEECRLKE